MTEHPTERPVTDQPWQCRRCGHPGNPPSQTSCGVCHRERDTAPLQPKGQLVEGQGTPTNGGVHGWRITLPDFSVVPLAKGTHVIGRGGAQPDIARVLRRFADVSRMQLELDVTSQTLEVHVPSPSGTSVFRVDGDQFTQIKTQTMGLADAWTLCLGQSCFVRIDRGVA